MLGTDGYGQLSDSRLWPCASPVLQEFSGNTKAGHRVVEQKKAGRVLCSVFWYDIRAAALCIETKFYNAKIKAIEGIGSISWIGK